ARAQQAAVPLIGLLGATTPHGPSAASFPDLRNPYFISGDAIPTGMGGRGISLVRDGGSTPTTDRGWMSTGATGLDWTAGGDRTSRGCGAASIPGARGGTATGGGGPTSAWRGGRSAGRGCMSTGAERVSASPGSISA